MLAQLAKDLQRDGVRLILAKSVGEMRDELSASGALDVLGTPSPTIDAAVELAHTDDTSAVSDTRGDPESGNAPT